MPPEFANNAQRRNYYKLRNYLSSHSHELYDPENGMLELTQYAGEKDGNCFWDYAIGEYDGKTPVTAPVRSDCAKYYDITHTHPYEGVPTGYPNGGKVGGLVFRESDMLMYRTAYDLNFRGTMHVYEVPTGNYYRFAPASKSSILNYWKILGLN